MSTNRSPATPGQGEARLHNPQGVYVKNEENGSNQLHDDALKLWHHLFDGERGLLHVWTAKRRGAELVGIEDANFHYPATAPEAAEWAFKKAEAGREVYFCAHLLTPIEGRVRRQKEYAANVRALWFEQDGGAKPNGSKAVKPSAVVESSPGHYHGYVRLTDSIPPQTAEALNRRLVRALDGDPSGSDLTQLLRVPGCVNHKYPERPAVRLLGIRPKRTYTAREIDEALPPEPEPEREHFDAREDADGEPPVVLDNRGLRVWRGEDAKLKDSGEIDKSATLMKIARVLFDAGANKPVIVDALAERDQALGYDKYSGNRDGGRREYERIAEKLKAEGRNGRRREPHGGADSATTYPKKGLKAVSFAEREMPPPQRFIVEGIVPAEMATSFYGAGGLAKSVNVLHLGLSVAFEGVEKWHHLAVQTCPVIYLDFEMAESVQLRRAKQLASGMGLPDVPKSFRYVEAAGHRTADVFRFAREIIEESYPGALVIVDSFGYSMQGESEKSSDVLDYIRNYLQPLLDVDSHVLVVDHIARLIKGERAADRDAFGSVYKTNSMRSTVNMTGHADKETKQVYSTFAHKKINVGPQYDPFTVATKFGKDRITCELADTVIHPPTEETTEQLIVAALVEQGPMTNREIAATIDRPLKTVQNTTGELKAEGALVETGERREREMVLTLRESAGTS